MMKIKKRQVGNHMEHFKPIFINLRLERFRTFSLCESKRVCPWLLHPLPLSFFSPPPPPPPPPVLQQKHDVFISFRGKDTRTNFTSHLDAAFRKKNIQIYIDYKLKRGYEIAEALFKAIEESVLSVVVFSENYASSSWCLDELVEIHEWSKTNKQIVIPVFYKVDPTHVRHQTGSYAVAFAEHQQNPGIDTNRMQKWKEALTETTNLAGLDSFTHRLESDFIEEIIKVVLKELSNVTMTAYDLKNFVGIERHISEVESLLHIDSRNFGIIGIWGIGGVGKTTIANAVYYKLQSGFDSCYFVANVRENSEKRGLNGLRNKLLSHILDKKIKISTPDLPPFVKNGLRRKKVLIVLDDVHKTRELEYLAGGEYLATGDDWFGSGSRIIVTTRDKGVFRKDDKIYEVEELNSHEALELFNFYAFNRKQPGSDYMEMSNKVLSYAKGIPLVLKVLGLTLARLKNPEEWADALKNLKKIPDSGIHDVLSLSYQGLNEEQKDIFLDIACFFKGENREFVIRILDACGFSAVSGLRVLADKSLVTISIGIVEMHDLLQEMGWEIVRQQSIKNPEMRSRLWVPGDVFEVLNQNMGTKHIESIYLDMYKIGEIDLNPAIFANFQNLRLLRFYNSDLEDSNKVCLLSDLECLPKKLRYLFWHGYPSKSLPSRFCPENLVELSMPYSNIEQLWNGVQRMANLKKIDLSYSRKLTNIQNLSAAGLSSLGELNLRGCCNLLQIPEDIGFLSSLYRLDLTDCTRLVFLPELPPFLRYLYATNCISLRKVSGSKVALNSRNVTEDTWNNHCRFPEFDFSGCLELDQESCSNILGDTETRMARLSGKLSHSLALFLPENKILDLIIHRAKGSCLAMRISPGFCDGSLLEFAHCVTEFNGDLKDFRLLCDLKINGGNIKNCNFPCLWYGTGFFYAHNIIFWYDPAFHNHTIKKNKNGYHSDVISYDISSINVYGSEYFWKVKQCGIWLFYAQELDKSFIVLSKDGGFVLNVFVGSDGAIAIVRGGGATVVGHAGASLVGGIDNIVTGFGGGGVISVNSGSGVVGFDGTAVLAGAGGIVNVDSGCNGDVVVIVDSRVDVIGIRDNVYGDDADVYVEERRRKTKWGNGMSLNLF
ncbi:Disease resistance protein (TIR-NBS-LRR class) [Quillaja saponaria]|uniref:Disease resistance protein (TIR-NBS-LRR class) n=1 Tax=Quillaja saponaria TaxID=32244 RepID=A0AAD7PCG3_QUISA|nr:Disease resistance protein (TIR-NBS-LRR class) [Quillaja saponaria]